MEYTINKGIGKSVEFKGLSSQYLFVFAGGLLAVFVLFVILYMIGIDQWVCIGFGVIAASMLVWPDIPPQCEIRAARTDEAGRQAPASALPD